MLFRSEENQEKLRRTRKLFRKLSIPKKFPNKCDENNAVRSINKKLNEARQRAKLIITEKRKPLKENSFKPTLERRNEGIHQLQNIIQRRYNERIKNSIRNKNKIKQNRQIQSLLKKEKQEKQILRSKVQTTLLSVGSKNCSKFRRDYQRFSLLLAKDQFEKANMSLQRNFINSYNCLNTESSITKEDPNIILNKILTKNQITTVIFIVNLD